MKTIIFCSLFLFTLSTAKAFAQKTNLDNLSEKERTEYLLEVTKDIIMKYAPGWYRDMGGYKIERKEHSNEVAIKSYGKVSYRVIRYYDTDKEIFNRGFSTQVLVNAETGKATDMTFGNDGSGFGSFDDPKYENEKYPFFKEFIEGVSSRKKQ